MDRQYESNGFIYGWSRRRLFAKSEDTSLADWVEVDEEGQGVDEEEQRRLDYMVANPGQYIDLGVQEYSWLIGKHCKCGSGEFRFMLHDCQGIPKRYVCNSCIDEVKKKYNRWVFEGYDQSFLDEYSGERIEDDY
jgi:hypothetical protein